MKIRKLICFIALQFLAATALCQTITGTGTIQNDDSSGTCGSSAFTDNAGTHYPDSTCTGWAPTGVTLTNHATSCTLSTASATYDSKRFNCSVTIAANNITITRSEINGIVENSGDRSGLSISDTLIDGQNSGAQCIGHLAAGGITTSNFTLLRVEMKNCNQGVYASRFTIDDSYIHDINGSDMEHIEGALGTGPGPLIIRGSTILGEANAASGPWNPGDGGVSSAVSFYVHGSFWPDITAGLTFTGNYLRGNSGGGVQASYCLYGGDSTADGEGGPGNATNNTTNGIIKNNIFARGTSNQCAGNGPITAPASGPGSCWSNNKYDNGTAINVSGVSACP